MKRIYLTRREEGFLFTRLHDTLLKSGSGLFEYRENHSDLSILAELQKAFPLTEAKAHHVVKYRGDVFGKLRMKESAAPASRSEAASLRKDLDLLMNWASRREHDPFDRQAEIEILEANAILV